MIDLIELAVGKLNHPILMDWAIDRYREAREGSSKRQRVMEQQWFDDLTLRRWLNSDDQEILNRMFVHLPEERFANMGQAIGERWNTWRAAWRIIPHRIHHWGSLDSSQRIYGVSVIGDVGGEPGASFAWDRYEELFREEPEHWCQLALSAPERRLLELLEQHLPRQQRLFDETFYQLARLVEPDTDA